jgi:hypothetical protein
MAIASAAEPGEAGRHHRVKWSGRICGQISSQRIGIAATGKLRSITILAIAVAVSSGLRYR